MPIITYQIRLPDHLRDDFLSACKENGLTGSSVLKQFMLDYISNGSSRIPVKNKPRKKSSSKIKDAIIPVVSDVQETSVTIEPVYIPPEIFNIEYLESQCSSGHFYYYDDNLIRHSVSEDEYWKVASSSVGTDKPDYWLTMDANELNYNISIGQRSRPRFKQLFYTGDSDKTKNQQKRSTKKSKKKRR